MQSSQNFEYGLLYEKKMFAKVVKRIIKTYNIYTVCEYPYNNLMGKNDDVFLDIGCKTERLKEIPLVQDKKFDLVWNFCEIERAQSPTKIIDNMLNLTKNYILIVTQNKNNLGVQLHRIYHKFKRTMWDHGNINFMSYKAVLNLIKGKAKPLEIGAFDIPWFILDFYEGGSLLRELVPKKLIPKDMSRIQQSFFERKLSKCKLGYALAHHHYVFAKKL